MIGFRSPSVIATVWRMAGSYRSVLARSIVWKAGQASAQAIQVGVIVLVIDQIRTDELASASLWKATAAIAACVIAQWVCGYFANRSAWIATFEMFGKLRLRALDHLRNLPISFHSTHRSGDTTTALTTDVAAVESFAHEPLQQLVGAMIAPIVVFVVLLFQDVPMALATMASVVASAPMFMWANHKFKALAAVRQARQADASSRMIEYINGLQVIRAFRLTGDRLARFRDSMDRYRSVNLELVIKMVPVGMGFMAVVLMGIPLVLFVGALWLFNGTVDAGTLIVFAVLVLRVYQPLVAAAESFESLRIADASLDRIATVLDEPAQVFPTITVAEPSDFTVTFDTVRFGYDTEVLRGVSFEARQGDLTAIVGPSGAGKSTILNLITRFWDVDEGTVRIGGVDVRELTAEQLFDAVTFVFQDVYLFPGTIADNISFGIPPGNDADEASLHQRVVEAATAAQADGFIRALPLGYNTPVGEGGTTLSGGERQRIAIARAMLKDAPVVLLDEATSAIDPTNERLVQQALSELVVGKTVIVVAHRLSTIRSAHQILVLQDGQIVERGTHDNLLVSDGLYRTLWNQRTHSATWSITR